MTLNVVRYCYLKTLLMFIQIAILTFPDFNNLCLLAIYKNVNFNIKIF